MTSLIFFIILPVIFFCAAYSAYRWGWPFMTVLIPAVLLFLIPGNVTAAAAFISLIAMGGMSGLVVSRRLSLKKYTAAVPLLAALLFSGDYYYIRHKTGIDILEESKKQMLLLLDSAEADQSRKDAVAVQLNVAIDAVREVVPFFVFLYALMFSALGYMLVKRFLVFLKKPLPEKGLAWFDLNGYLIFALIGAWAAVLLSSGEHGILYTVSLNAALMISALYFVQALGILSFVFSKKHLPDYLIVVLILILFFLGGGIGTIFVIMLTGFGVLDLWADFRKIRTGH